MKKTQVERFHVRTLTDDIVNAPVRRCEKISLSHYRRGRGRPKMSWNEVIRSDMKITGVTEDMTQDRNLWRSRIKIVEHR